MFDFSLCASDSSQALFLLSFGASLSGVVCQVFEEDRLVEDTINNSQAS